MRTANTVDIIVVGGGQAGLAMSRCLTGHAVDHVVLERGEVANSWRTERWDSLRLLTPNWLSRLPGWSYRGADPHGYMTVAELIDRWLPTGLVAHIQINDRNRRGPGEGEDRFAPVFAALARQGYRGDVAIEPFRYEPDGRTTAARAIGYVRGILEALDERRLNGRSQP